MTSWLSDASANRHIKTYVKDFLDLSGNLTVRSSEDYAWNSYGQVLSGPYESDGGVYFGVGVGMDVSGLTIVVGARSQDGAASGTDDGVAIVYRYDTTAELWYQLGNTITGETTNGDFGFNVDINDAGTRITATDPVGNFVNVYDYNSNTNTWDKQVNITAHGIGPYAGRISGDGNTIIFGEYTVNTNTGIIYIYRNTSGSTWTKIGEFTGTHTYTYSGLGPSISYDGNRITFSESNYNFDADGNSADDIGRVAIYDYSGSGTTWNQVGDWIYGEKANDRLGAAQALSKDGSIVAIWSEVRDSNTDVKVYQYDTSVDGSWNQLGTKIQGSTTTFGAGTQLSDDGTVLLINDRYDDTAGTDNGAVFIYKYTNGDWVQQGSTLYGQYTGAQLGFKHNDAIAMSGDGTKIVAGGGETSVNGTYSGYVQAWQWSQKYNTNPALDISNGTVTVWGRAEDISANYLVTQLGSTLTGNNDLFGYAVNMNYTGDTMVTTAHTASSNAGNTYVYKYRNNMWSQVGTTVIGSASGQYLGTPCQISNDGKTIALGSHTATDGGNEGAIYVYEYVNGDWSQKGSTLDGSTSGNNELFGARDTCLSGDGTVVAGYASEGGYAKVFKYVAGSTNDWVQMGSTFTTNSMNVGSTSIGVQSRLTGLSDDGTIFAVSSISDDTTGTNNGKVEVYKFTGEAGSGSWSQLGSTIYGINHSSGESKEGSTISLSADGTILATGSWYYNSYQGIIRVYKYIESIEEWTQMGTHILHDTADAWARGYEMSADGKTLAVGVANEDDGGTDRGAVYIYKYMDGNWVFIKQVNSPYGVDSTYLGKYVTISGDGKRFAAGSDTNPGLVVAWEITNNPALKIENNKVIIPHNLDVSNNVTVGGKVGIGTNNPVNSLHIGGDGTLRLNNSGKGAIQGTSEDIAIHLRVGYDGTTTDVIDLHAYDRIRFWTGGSIASQSLKMTIESDGTVGIGTSTPNGALHIYEATGTAPGTRTGTLVLDHGDTAGISSITFPSRLNNGSDYGYISYQDDYVNSTTNERAQLTIGTSNDGDDDLVFSPSGNLGIKTSDPSYTCHVNGTYYAGSSFYWGNGTSGYCYVGTYTSYSRLYFLNPNGAYIYIYAAYDAVTSDDRLKTDEKMITNATETIMKLSPQKYKMYDNFDLSGNYREESGLIAQDVYYNSPELRHIVELNVDASGNIIQPLPLPDGVNTTHDIQNDPDYKALGWGDEAVAVYYYQFIPYLIKSNQEQQEKINELKSQITNLVTEITALESA